MLFETKLDAGHQPVKTSRHPGFEIAMTPAFNTYGFEAGIEGQ